MSIVRSAAVVGSFVSLVAAHGHVSGIVADGVYYVGYDPAFQYDNPPPAVAGWSDPEDLGNGFIDPNNYTTPEIICHLGATPGAAAVNVVAGDMVELQWTPWPTSHHGPVLNYLAPVSGSFASIDKTQLQFFKIGEVGLIDDSSPPGTWATDQLIANNNSWVITIPKTIAAGNYVLRHEIIALHSAAQTDGAQNYPQCVNLVVSGGGSDKPAGESAEKFYTPTDPGISIDIYSPISTYVIPGPALYSGAVSAAQTTLPFTSYAPTTSGGGGTSPTATSQAPTTAPTTSTTLVTTTKSPMTTTKPSTTGSTTTTKPTTTTTTATTSGGGSGSGAAHYAQCGGQGWTGATTCLSPYTCQVLNPYYSQCL